MALVPPTSKILITYNNIEHHVHVAVSAVWWGGEGRRGERDDRV